MKTIIKLLSIFSFILFFSCEEDELLEEASFRMNEVFDVDGENLVVSVEQMRCNVKVRYITLVMSSRSDMKNPMSYDIPLENLNTVISGLENHTTYYYYFKLSNYNDSASTDVRSFYFSYVNYTLTLSASPSTGGTVSGGGIFAYKKSVTIKATPYTGYSFNKWSDGNTDAIRTISMTSNRTLIAYFTVNSYKLTLSAFPSNGGSVTGEGTYEYNKSATIKATPSSGYSFSKWSDGNTSASRTITMTAEKSLTAIFTINSYKLTVSASPSSGGTVTGGGSYEYGKYATIKATPASGYTFDSWSDGNTSASRSYYVTESKTLTAYFTKAATKYTLTLSASPSSGGTVTGGGTYEYGEYATIKATPASGYTFDGW
ncbi:MAG: hypothetical protein IKQ08_08565, partial [Paludibacteraceae bacterium]|nr:hypothetical protein [Paludibacteraceae bacterium]